MHYDPLLITPLTPDTPLLTPTPLTPLLTPPLYTPDTHPHPISDETLAKQSITPAKNFLALDVRLSHMPTRPLFNMEAAGSYVLKVGKPREKIVDSNALKQYLHQTGK